MRTTSSKRPEPRGITRSVATLSLALILLGSRASGAQAADVDALPDAPAAQASQATAGDGRDDSLALRLVPRRMLRDEWAIVRSPAKLQRRDLRWLLPVAAASAAALATDTYTMRTVVTRNPNFNASADTASSALRDVMIAAPVALFGAGEWAHADHATEAGLLAGEAMVNAYATDEGIKYITLRERPGIANQRGHFWQSDAAGDPSFVSGHAVVAWSSAAVLAAEYPKPWQQIGVYTLASGVSLTRVLSEQHFPSDVLLGSVTGWLIGRYVYRAHHRPGR